MLVYRFPLLMYRTSRSILLIFMSLVSGSQMTLRTRAQFGIAMYRRLHMPGHIYFGNDDDVPFVAVFHYVLNLFLRVKTAVRPAVEVGVAAP